MKSFFNQLNNREIALFIWFAILIILMLAMAKGIVRPIKNMARILFSLKFLMIFFPFCLYLFLAVFFLWKVKFWNYDLHKDTIVWVFTVALPLFFLANKHTDVSFFKNLLFESFKWTIFLEFVANLYVFSLPVELILVPIILFTAMLQAYANTQEQYKDVNKYLKNFIAITSFCLAVFSLVKTVQHYKAFFSIGILKEIILPPLLTILYLPALYVITLVMEYETLFLQVKFLTENPSTRKQLKEIILRKARLDITKVKNIASNIMWARIETIKDLDGYINAISKKKLHSKLY